jgi:hypothetical protein
MKLIIKIITITIIYLSVCLSAYNQVNLIKDGSFEDTTANWDTWAAYHTLNNWYGVDTSSITGQPVNYWVINSLFSSDPNFNKLPSNPYFHQYPKYGHGAIAMVPYYDFIQYYNLQYIRSILKGSLHQQLIAGKQYCATIYVTQSERLDFFNTNGLGLYFDNGGIDTAYTIHHDSSGAYTYVTPQVQCGFLIDDTLNWMKIQGSFTANGTEDHITIGNFLSDSATQKQIMFGSSNVQCYCQNILIDNVSLVPIDLHDWLQPTYYSAAQDSVWVGLPKYDYSDGNWYTINKTYITTGPGFWLHAPLENGKQFIHEIDVCGVMKYDTTTLIQAPMAINGHHKANFNINIYPNPSAGKFTINCLNSAFNETLKVEVIDIFGRVLYAQQHQANLGIVAINTQLTTGNYIVKIKNVQGTVITKKITVN